MSALLSTTRHDYVGHNYIDHSCIGAGRRAARDDGLLGPRPAAPVRRRASPALRRHQRPAGPGGQPVRFTQSHGVLAETLDHGSISLVIHRTGVIALLHI